MHMSRNFHGSLMPKSISTLLSLYTTNFSFALSKTERNVVASLCHSAMSACCTQDTRWILQFELHVPTVCDLIEFARVHLQGQ